MGSPAERRKFVGKGLRKDFFEFAVTFRNPDRGFLQVYNVDRRSYRKQFFLFELLYR